LRAIGSAPRENDSHTRERIVTFIQFLSCRLRSCSIAAGLAIRPQNDPRTRAIFFRLRQNKSSSRTHPDLQSSRRTARPEYYRRTIGNGIYWSHAPESHVTYARWDVFISHATEDKESVAHPLADALSSRGPKVWYDEFSLRPGDSLRRAIDQGLALSRHGVVVLSPAFFRKEWAQRELGGLLARETRGAKVILPVWHGLMLDESLSYSPVLADRLAIPFSIGLERVVDQLLEAIRPAAFVASPTIDYLAQKCGFEISHVEEALVWADSFGLFVEELIALSGRRDMYISMVATFELSSARVGLNNAREILGLPRFDSEFF
jgi:hypothetical protein